MAPYINHNEEDFIAFERGLTKSLTQIIVVAMQANLAIKRRTENRGEDPVCVKDCEGTCVVCCTEFPYGTVSNITEIYDKYIPLSDIIDKVANHSDATEEYE